MVDDSTPVDRRAVYRRLFLDAVAKHRPHVVADLAREPYQAYRALMEAWRVLDAGAFLLQPSSQWPEHVPSPPPQEHAALMEALADFGRRWQLTDDWLRDSALATIRRWENCGQINGRWDLPPTDETSEIFLDRPPLITFTAEAYQPWREEPAAYRARVLADLKAQLDCFIAATKEVADAWKLLPPTKRVPALHAAWTARYQVPGQDGTYESCEVIADSVVSVGEKAVESGVAAFSKVIDLSPRPGRAGPSRQKPCF